jgi:uncharacterized RDD family membrane protein YckC
LEEAELRRLHEQNTITVDTPVWTEGMAEWVPFHASALSPAAAAAGGTAATHTCAECGKLFPEDEMLQYEQAWVCAACKPVFFQRIKEGVAPLGVLAYASVGRRFLAILVDGLILGILVFAPIMVILLTASMKSGDVNGTPAWMTILTILEYLLPAAYEIFFIGKYGATPGKMLMKIKVVSPDGGPISYGRSTGRYFAKMLSGIILYIGYLMAFWDEEKRALHDRICKTRVINSQAS